MPICAVATCKNYNQKTKGSVTYHRFPRDSVLQKIWESKCQRADKINLATARICSIHFTKEDYDTDLKTHLLGLPKKRRLKPTASPSQNLPVGISVENDNEVQPSDKRNSRKLARHEIVLPELKGIAAKQKKPRKSGSPVKVLHQEDHVIAGCFQRSGNFTHFEHSGNSPILLANFDSCDEENKQLKQRIQYLELKVYMLEVQNKALQISNQSLKCKVLEKNISALMEIAILKDKFGQNLSRCPK